jgi:hypothetical protein
MSKKGFLAITALFIAGAAVRCIGLTRPLLGNFYARAIEDAMIAESFIRNGFNILRPAISNIVDGSPGLLLTNFHLYSYLVAIISKLLPMDMDLAGRALSVVFSMLAGLYVYKLTRYLSDAKTAAIALFLYLFSPLSIIYGQSYQAEAMGLFLILFSVYYFILFMDWRTFGFFALSLISGVLVFLTKVPWLPFILLFLWIYFLKCRTNGVPLLERKSAVFLTGLMFIPMAAWLVYIYTMRTSPGVFISIFDEASGGKVILKGAYFTDPVFYKTLFGYLLTLVLNPIGFALFLAGIFTVKERFLKGFLAGWLVLFLLYCALIPKKVFEQNYYLLPVLPVMTIYAASAVKAISERASALPFKYYKIWAIVLGLAFVLSSSRFFLFPAFVTPDEFKHAVYAGKKVSDNTDEEDLVIASSRGKSYLLYYSDRFGWNLDASGKEAASRIESLRDEGASYFAADYPAVNFKDKELRQYMFRNYRPVIESEELVLYDVRKKR